MIPTKPAEDKDSNAVVPQPPVEPGTSSINQDGDQQVFGDSLLKIAEGPSTSIHIYS